MHSKLPALLIAEISLLFESRIFRVAKGRKLMRIVKSRSKCFLICQISTLCLGKEYSCWLMERIDIFLVYWRLAPRSTLLCFGDKHGFAQSKMLWL